MMARGRSRAAVGRDIHAEMHERLIQRFASQHDAQILPARGQIPFQLVLVDTPVAVLVAVSVQADGHIFVKLIGIARIGLLGRATAGQRLEPIRRLHPRGLVLALPLDGRRFGLTQKRTPPHRHFIVQNAVATVPRLISGIMPGIPAAVVAVPTARRHPDGIGPSHVQAVAFVLALHAQSRRHRRINIVIRLYGILDNRVLRRHVNALLVGRYLGLGIEIDDPRRLIDILLPIAAPLVGGTLVGVFLDKDRVPPGRLVVRIRHRHAVFIHAGMLNHVAQVLQRPQVGIRFPFVFFIDGQQIRRGRGFEPNPIVKLVLTQIRRFVAIGIQRQGVDRAAVRRADNPLQVFAVRVRHPDIEHTVVRIHFDD